MRYVIFDFDGTLADTAPLIVATMQASMRELELPERSAEECRATIGLRLEEIPAVLWPEVPDMGERYSATYRRIFDELKRPLAVSCFPGVTETLRELRRLGYGMAIASSRNRESLREYAEGFGLTDCFDMLVGGDDVSRGKPAPDPVLKICGEMGWRPEECLVVGDAVFDLEMGRNAGARTCGVTYGNQSRAELATASPDGMIDSIAELLDFLRNFAK